MMCYRLFDDFHTLFAKGLWFMRSDNAGYLARIRSYITSSITIIHDC